MRAERELPVVWAVAKGSFRNKLILVPAAIAISALVPWLITPLLMLGGAYLCFEGPRSWPTSFCPMRRARVKSTLHPFPMIWWRLSSRR